MMRDTQADVSWLYGLSMPVGSAEITGSVWAPTPDKAADQAIIQASIPLDHGLGLVKGTVTLTPAAASVRLELDLGAVCFSAELGKDGVELHLETVLDFEVAEIQAEERLASWPFVERQGQTENNSFRERQQELEAGG
jgi:hypothetical protein